MARPLLPVIVGSTRPGRLGVAVGRWIDQLAREHGPFDVELVDLAAGALPLYDEPHHPRLGRHIHQHSRDCSGIVSRADV